MSAAKYESELAPALMRRLAEYDLGEMVVLTARQAEDVYQMLLNWAFREPRYEQDAEEAMAWLGFESPFCEIRRS